MFQPSFPHQPHSKVDTIPIEPNIHTEPYLHGKCGESHKGFKSTIH